MNKIQENRANGNKDVMNRVVQLDKGSIEHRLKLETTGLLKGVLIDSHLSFARN